MLWLKKRNLLIDFILFTLVLLSLFSLYSTGGTDTINWTLSVNNVVLRQIVFVFFGVIFYLLFGSLDYQFTRTVYFHTFLMVMIVMILGGLFILAPEINATHRWYKIGDFLWQPTEFAKVVTIFWTAFWLSLPHEALLKKIFSLGSGIGILAILIFLQPDLGNTIILLLIVGCIVTMYLWNYDWFKFFLITTMIGGSNVIYFLLISMGKLTNNLLGVFMVVFLLAWISYVLIWQTKFLSQIIYSISLLIVMVLVSFTMWNFGLHNYQRERLFSYIKGNSDQTADFQTMQARVALGSGRLMGKGPGHGTQSRLRFLPEFRTDFIFSAFGEEWGLIGGWVVMLLYLTLIIILLLKSMNIADGYAQIILVGILIRLWIEVGISLAMNMRLIPTTGIPLPFFSYGGSSIISWFIMFGIIQSIFIHDTFRFR